MLLIDLSGILWPVVMWQLSKDKKTELDINLVRHILINIIRMHVKNNKNYGQVVICLDNIKYWRKEYFPFYKSHRKKNREKSDVNWNLLFKIFNELKVEIEKNLPYKVITVEGAEADDIIGTLVPIFAPHEKIMIISGDEDFLQLQRYSNVSQYSPTQKKLLKNDNPELELKRKIIGGDAGDGIPNILSPGNCFVLQVRQTTMSSKRMDTLLKEDWNKLPDTNNTKINFKRNETLIDLMQIPKEIKQNIINTFESITPPKRGNLINYFMEHRMKVMIECLDDF